MKYAHRHFIERRGCLIRFSDFCFDLLDGSEEVIEVAIPSLEHLAPDRLVREMRSRWPAGRVAICKKQEIRIPKNRSAIKIRIFNFDTLTVVGCDAESSMIIQLLNGFLHWGDHAQIIRQLDLHVQRSELEHRIKEMEDAEKRLAQVVAEIWF